MIEREEFLKTLPANVRTKLKKLQFADNEKFIREIVCEFTLALSAFAW